MTYQACLSCGTPAERRRCDDCQRDTDRRRGSTTARGYGHRWQQRSAAVLRAQPECAACGTTGDDNNPLTVDHLVPKAADGSDDPRNLRTLCRRHNSAKGTR